MFESAVRSNSWPEVKVDYIPCCLVQLPHKSDDCLAVACPAWLLFPDWSIHWTDGSPIGDAVCGVIPVDIVGIQPQANAGEGVGLQVEVTNCQGLGNCRCRVVGTSPD